MLNNSIILHFCYNNLSKYYNNDQWRTHSGEGVFNPHPMVWKGVHHGIFFTMKCIIDVQQLIC